ncbi:Fanconi anemia group M protein [Pseudonaja textilis]|uniref:Fanconi anemia group M protein n=1 Tax=Pseudonaja textilis TaxID=8673 RepID=UPI000EAA5C6E|nr:Fanconi anemia group M protein [Pseudonaja textilis]
MKGRSRQATLFQAWGTQPTPAPAAEEEEEEEAALLAAAIEAEAADSPSSWPPPSGASAARGFIGGAPGALWMFPSGGCVEERAYQVRASWEALLANTLLCLPTGLGKTLVAAVVMYNFYRWFPGGKILFLAPTKPLVAQQREACARLLGIPAAHMAEMTGGTQIVDRKEIWRTKRVFFLTPQIMANDLSRGTCPAAEIKCLVIDEAHKALGNHAYCQVVKELCKYTKEFRVLALSATPGSDAKAVQQVITNLLISHIELCSEDSPDIQPYSHERRIEKCVVPLGKELTEIQNAYIRVLEIFTSRLSRLQVLPRHEISALTKYQIILARDQFRKNPASRFERMQQGAIEGDFALCISLYHGYELLLQMGMRSLHTFLHGIMDGSKGMTRAKNELGRNEEFMMLYSQLENMFLDSASSNGNIIELGAENTKTFIYSHPKLKKLEDVVLQHFRSWRKHQDQITSEVTPTDTRVMIFSSFRDSVQEIAEMLNYHYPLVRVMTFVGHSTGKNTKGFTQKEQLEVVKHFREGGYNTLVSTCVGEEGLDIGEVDLIICFDAQKSPIRLVQRMGRTGRKRQGRIVVILSEGREERTYNQSQSNRKNLLKTLSKNKGLHLYQHSPRMIPDGLTPKMHRMLITPPEKEPDTSTACSKKKGLTLGQNNFLSFASAGTKQASPTESWCLTTEEYEKWDRLYQIKAGEGIKKPIMPRSQFVTLECKDTRTELETKEVHELSLTEWTVWQNRPFPTYLVDHSDRCFHFISVMDMIEQMRHEEGVCSYELEIQPYFHWEDVHASNEQTSKRCDTVTLEKVSSGKKTAATAKEKYSLQEFDAECMSLFKVANFKSSKRPQVIDVETAIHAKRDGSTLDCFSTNLSPFLEATGQESLADENQENMDAALNTSIQGRTFVNPEKAMTKAIHPAPENCIQNGERVDSDYGCFADDAYLSSLFYLPVPEIDLFRFSETNADENFSWEKDIQMSVARFLSQSPPSLDEWFASKEKKVDEDLALDSLQQSVSSKSKDNIPEKSVCFKNMSISPQNSCELLNTRKLCSMDICPLETNNIPDTFLSSINDLSWDDIFEVETEEQNGIQGEKLSKVNNSPAQNSLKRYNGKSCGKTCKPSGRNVNPEEDCSIYLLGDHAQSSQLPAEKMGAPSELTGLCSQANMQSNNARTPECHFSDQLASVHSTNPITSLTPHRNEVEVSGGLDHGSKPNPHDYEELYNASEDLFSVNFDLGFSFQESEDDALEQMNSMKNKETPVVGHSNRVEASFSNSSLVNKYPSNECFNNVTKSSTPLNLQNHNPGLAAIDPAISLASPFTPATQRFYQSPNHVKTVCSTPTGGQMIHNRTSCSRNNEESSHMRVSRKANTSIVKVLAKSAFGVKDLPSNEPGDSSEKEEFSFLNRKKRKTKVLRTSDISDCDIESPICAVKKRKRPLIASDVSSDESTDFAKKPKPVLQDRKNYIKKPVQDTKRQKKGDRPLIQNLAKHFIDEEAEISEDGVEISSDESIKSEDELNSSLVQFLDDETQIAQDLNESEMQAVYLKSVRSPAVGNKYKMVHKEFNPITVFSQIPEQDECYVEDSFCVNEEDNPKSSSSDEDVHINFDLLGEESFVDGRKQYQTRHRKKMKVGHTKQKTGMPLAPKRFTRVRILNGSSEDEETDKKEEQMGSRVSAKVDKDSNVTSLTKDQTLPQKCSVLKPQESHAQVHLEKSCLPEQSDFHPQIKDQCKYELVGKTFQIMPKPEKSLENLPGRSSSSSSWTLRNSKSQAPLCILVDNHEISSGPEVISTLKTVHGVKVEICSLGSCDYIVSNRLAVERKCQAELVNNIHQSKMVQRMQQLKNKFDRICIIVEKERIRTGEAWKVFHRTKHYDSMLSAFIQAGIKVLFSACQVETADLLKELALVEQRKNAAIRVPTEVEGPRQDVFRFYLSIPCVSYTLALALCHHFGSLKEMANSTPREMAGRTQVNQQKAEEVYRYIQYTFDTQMLPMIVT